MEIFNYIHRQAYTIREHRYNESIGGITLCDCLNEHIKLFKGSDFHNSFETELQRQIWSDSHVEEFNGTIEEFILEYNKLEEQYRHNNFSNKKIEDYINNITL